MQEKIAKKEILPKFVTYINQLVHIFTKGLPIAQRSSIAHGLSMFNIDNGLRGMLEYIVLSINYTINLVL